MATPQIMEMSMPPEITEDVEVKAENLLSVYASDDGKLFWFVGMDEPQEVKLTDLRKVAERENLIESKRNKLITVLKISDNAPFGLAIAILDELNLAEIKITAEIAKKLDPEGKPTKRQRRFTLAPFKEDDLKKIKDL